MCNVRRLQTRVFASDITQVAKDTIRHASTLMLKKDYMTLAHSRLFNLINYLRQSWTRTTLSVDMRDFDLARLM